MFTQSQTQIQVEQMLEQIHYLVHLVSGMSILPFTDKNEAVDWLIFLNNRIKF